VREVDSQYFSGKSYRKGLRDWLVGGYMVMSDVIEGK